MIYVGDLHHYSTLEYSLAIFRVDDEFCGDQHMSTTCIPFVKRGLITFAKIVMTVLIAMMPSGCGVELPGLTSANDNTKPDDSRPTPPTLTFAVAAVSCQEGDGTVAIDVRLHTHDGPLTEAISVLVADTPSGSAASGADYVFANAVLVFEAGADDGQTRVANVTLLTDNESDPDETVELALGTPSAGRYWAK